MSALAKIFFWVVEPSAHETEGPGRTLITAYLGSNVFPEIRLHAFEDLALDLDLSYFAKEAVEILGYALPDEGEIGTYLSNSVLLKDQPITDVRRIIVLPEQAKSADQAFVKTIADTYLATRASKFNSVRGPVMLHAPTERELTARRLEAVRRKTLLLHICCGPDAAGVINQLKRDFDVTCFWYDPNIQPREEHDLRLEAFKQVADIEQVPYIVGEYDVDRFYQKIEGLEHTPEQGAKCSSCYDLRLERSAIEAKRLGCDYYSTTLAISPHKVQQKLKAFGRINEKRFGVRYFAKNFMKDDGFKLSVEYTERYNIYRQDYCGCFFSLHEGGPDAQKKSAEWHVTPADLRVENYKNPFYVTQTEGEIGHGPIDRQS